MKPADLIPNQTILAHSLLFQGASELCLSAAAAKLKRFSVSQGKPIFLERDESKLVYFIESGRVEILSYKPELRTSKQVAVLGVGEIFSEFSILAGSPHSTSAFALEECRLATLAESDFHQIVDLFPELAQNLVQRLAQINRQVMHAGNYVEYFKESQLQFDPSFIDLMPLEMMERFSAVPVAIHGNTLTVGVKAPIDHEFIQRFRAFNPTTELKLSLLSESSLQSVRSQMREFYEKPERARSLVRAAALDHTEPSEPSVRELLNFTSIFSHLPSELLDEVAVLFERRVFGKGDTIFRPGTESEYLYLIQTGQVSLSRELAENSLSAHVVTLSAFDSFAEISILTSTTHALLAKSQSPTVLFTLEKRVFESLLKNPKFSLSLLRVVARRLQQVNSALGVAEVHAPKDYPVVDLAGLLPEEIMESQKIVPLHKERKEVTLGLLDSANEGIFTVLHKYLSDYHVRLKQLSEKSFRDACQALRKRPRLGASGQRAKLSGRVSKRHRDTAHSPWMEIFPMGVVVRRGENLWLNPAVRSLLGTGETSILSVAEWFSRAFPDRCELMRNLYEADRAIGFPKAQTFYLKDASGALRLVEFRAAIRDNKELWLLNDFTERAATEEKFSQLFDFDLNGRLLLEAGKVVSANRAALQLFELGARTDILGSDLKAFDPKVELETALQLCAVKGIYRGEAVVHTHKDRDVPVEVLASSLELGNSSTILLTLHDISERKRGETRLAQASKMASLGEMAAGLAHEINNPLSVVLAASLRLRKIAERGQTSAEGVAELTGKIDKMVERISKIARGLRLFSHSSEQDALVDAKLVEIVADTLELCHSRFEKKSILFSSEGIAPSLQLRCHPVQMSQVLLNLFNNAADAIDELPERWIRVRAKDLGSAVEIVVENSGPKIPERVKQRLFQQFYTTKELGRGTGLGLSICRNIVHAHGGQIWCDTSAEFTRFVFRIQK